MLALWTFACGPTRVEPTTVPEPRELRRVDDGDTSRRRARGRPRLEHATFSAANEMTLQFSEPVAPTSGFDPRQFRLSIGAHDSEAGESATYYYDVAELSESDDPVQVDRVETIDDTRLRLVLDQMLPAEVCEPMSDPSAHEVAGIFLHYLDHDATGIVDLDGNRLKDIAAGWVLRGAEEALYYGRHAHRLLALGPISCDFVPSEPAPRL